MAGRAMAPPVRPHKRGQGDNGQNSEALKKRPKHKNDADEYLDAIIAMDGRDEHALTVALKNSCNPDLLKSRIVTYLPVCTNFKSNKYTERVFGLLLDPNNPEKNEWLQTVEDCSGNGKMQLAARYADADAMKILVEQGGDLLSEGRYSKIPVLPTALKYNKNVETIKYLILKTFEDNPDSIPLKMYAALTDAKLIQGKALEEILSSLDQEPWSAPDQHPYMEYIAVLFQLSVSFKQQHVLQSLFDRNLVPDMAKILNRACDVDDGPTTDILISRCDDAHILILARCALKTDSPNTLVSILTNFTKRTAVYSKVRLRAMLDLFELAMEHHNIIAWRILAAGWPQTWGRLRKATQYALKSNSSEYVEALYTAGLFSVDNQIQTYVCPLRYAAKWGTPATLDWVINNLEAKSNIKDLDLLNVCESNENNCFWSISRYLQEELNECTVQQLFDRAVRSGDRYLIEWMVMNYKDLAPCTSKCVDVALLLLLLEYLHKEQQSHNTPFSPSAAKESSAFQAGCKYLAESNYEAKHVLGTCSATPLPTVTRNLIIGYYMSAVETMRCIPSHLMPQKKYAQFGLNSDSD
jgi:hypothetical protein